MVIRLKHIGLGRAHLPPAARRLVAYFAAGLLILAAAPRVLCTCLVPFLSRWSCTPRSYIASRAHMRQQNDPRRRAFSPPRGAVAIPPGDDSGSDWTIRPHTTYWFAPGTHTLGTGQYSQIVPADGDAFIGAPGAILDGRGDNHYAFAGAASNVTIKYLTIQDFGNGSSATTPSGANGGQGVVNNGSGHGWVMKYLTVQHNAGAGRFCGHR